MAEKKQEKRKIIDQGVFVGRAHTDPKGRLYLPDQVAKELSLKYGEDIVFLRVGDSSGSIKGVAAYPGNIIISKLEDELIRTGDPRKIKKKG